MDVIGSTYLDNMIYLIDLAISLIEIEGLVSTMDVNLIDLAISLSNI